MSGAALRPGIGKAWPWRRTGEFRSGTSPRAFGSPCAICCPRGDCGRGMDRPGVGRGREWL